MNGITPSFVGHDSLLLRGRLSTGDNGTIVCCCSVLLQCAVAVCCCSVLQSVAVCCTVLQCATLCCSVLQWWLQNLVVEGHVGPDVLRRHFRSPVTHRLGLLVCVCVCVYVCVCACVCVLPLGLCFILRFTACCHLLWHHSVSYHLPRVFYVTLLPFGSFVTSEPSLVSQCTRQIWAKRSEGGTLVTHTHMHPTPPLRTMPIKYITHIYTYVYIYTHTCMYIYIYACK